MTYRRKKVSKFNYYTSVKKTYEDHLVELLKEPFYKKIKDICDSLKEKNKTNSKQLKAFQGEMANVKKWDYDELKQSAKFVVNKSKSSYIPKLIRAVIISNIKLLTATASKKKVEIEKTIPEPIAFFHRCFIEISKSFYTEPFLICDAGQQPGLRLKNITESIEIIERGIRKTINSFLPFDTILDVYLAQAEEDSDSEDDEPEPPKEESEDEESEIDEDEESESEIGDDEESEVDEDEESEIQDDESDRSSVHSDGGDVVDLSEDGELVTDTDFIAEDDEELSIDDDLPDELNLLPMKSEIQSPRQEKVDEKKPEPQAEVKTITVKKVTPNDVKSTITKEDDGVVFFDDADDL